MGPLREPLFPKLTGTCRKSTRWSQVRRIDHAARTKYIQAPELLRGVTNLSEKKDCQARPFSPLFFVFFFSFFSRWRRCEEDQPTLWTPNRPSKPQTFPKNCVRSVMDHGAKPHGDSSNCPPTSPSCKSRAPCEPRRYKIAMPRVPPRETNGVRSFYTPSAHIPRSSPVFGCRFPTFVASQCNSLPDFGFASDGTLYRRTSSDGEQKKANLSRAD